jgi:heparan-alpha-glucosaminide N-acetyltransferase
MFECRFYSGDDVHQPLRIELSNTVFHFWPQWLCILLVTLAWVLITLVPKLPNCPRGYLGPGGKHDHGRYENCTGGNFRIKRDYRSVELFIGTAGYIDRLIVRSSHLDNNPTCKAIYNTRVPFDPEGSRSE